MFDQEIELIEENLVAAISAVEDAVGHKPKGFRAPAFSIPQSRPDIFALICKYFDYDSSFVLSKELIESGDYKNLEIFSKDDFKEFPIVPKPFFFENIQIKSGGTFMRLFSSNIMQSVMDFNIDKGFIPLIYMHPYDYLHEKEFWVDYHQFRRLPFFKRLNKYIRQNQWLGYGNRKTLSKVATILKDYQHIGRMGFES